MGLFATRTPHRPNAIGLSLVKLDSVQGNTVFLSGVDVCYWIRQCTLGGVGDLEDLGEWGKAPLYSANSWRPHPCVRFDDPLFP